MDGAIMHRLDTKIPVAIGASGSPVFRVSSALRGEIVGALIDPLRAARTRAHPATARMEAERAFRRIAHAARPRDEDVRSYFWSFGRRNAV